MLGDLHEGLAPGRVDDNLRDIEQMGEDTGTYFSRRIGLELLGHVVDNTEQLAGLFERRTLNSKAGGTTALLWRDEGDQLKLLVRVPNQLCAAGGARGSNRG